MRFIYKYIGEREKLIFEKFKSYKSLTLYDYFILFLKGTLSLIESIIRNISGPFGFKIRQIYYNSIFAKSGKNILIDSNVIIDHPQNIELGSNIWIGSFSVISPILGKIKIGNNVHINTACHLGGRSEIVLEENVNISSGVRIFSGSANLATRDKKIWNPMMLEDLSLLNFGIVHIKENATIFANCTISPKTKMGEGSVLLPNSFLNKNTDAFEIFCGSPAKKIGKRFG